MRGKPIATSPRPSKTGTLQNAAEFTGAGAIDGVGVGVGELEGVGEGVAKILKAIVGVTKKILKTNFIYFQRATENPSDSSPALIIRKAIKSTTLSSRPCFPSLPSTRGPPRMRCR